MTQPTWRDLDLASREREYSPSSCIGGDYRPFVESYAQLSAHARARLQGPHARLDLPYGPRATQRLDLFVPLASTADPAQRKPPLLVFIHGGYWQELSKAESAFAAAQCVDQGIAFAALDYTLAPEATVLAMVTECRQAVSWLCANAASLGVDAERFVVAGSSAGAHLAAMTALPEEPPLAGSPASNIKGAVLVSGIYELEPLVGTSINAALGLTAESARALSPARRTLTNFPPSLVCWGAVETAEFKRQSRDFAAQLGKAGRACETFEVPDRNHFDVILDLADPGAVLGRAVAKLFASL